MATMVERLTPERRRQLTRQALVHAAAEVFAERGYGGASLEEIASRAGFTRGAIYSNFSGKEELLWAVLDDMLEQQLKAYGAAISEGGPDFDPADRAARAASVWRSLSRPEFVLLSLELNALALRDPAIRERLARQDRDQIERAVAFIEEQFAEEGITSRVSPREIALIGRAADWGLQLHAEIDPEHAEEYRAALTTLFALLGDATDERVPGSG